MNWESLRRFATPGVILGALAVGLLLFVAAAIWVFWFAPPPGRVTEAPEAALTLLPGPSSTPPSPTATPPPPSTPTPTLEPLAPGEMGLGSYVQVVGTAGGGLNIRRSPSLASEVNFLGFDAEVFEVRDGPVEADGYTWWYLVTPVDEARNGWAAATFLELVANP